MPEWLAPISDHVDADTREALIRLAAACLVGILLGINRDMNGKPTGMRTLGLVALGAAGIATATVHYAGLDQHPDALSRVVQGLIQGVLTGVGFIGAGVILRDSKALDVRGLTTAATVWVTAALGVACGLGAWPTVLIGTALALLLLAGLKPVERWLGMGDANLKRRDDGSGC